MIPCPATLSRWHSAASWPGTGLPAAIAPASVSTVMISPGLGPWAGPLAFPLARMRSASSTSRRSPGGTDTGSTADGAAGWPGGRRPEGEPDQSGSVAYQVKPPGAARGHGLQSGDAQPGGRPSCCPRSRACSGSPGHRPPTAGQTADEASGTWRFPGPGRAHPVARACTWRR